MKSPTFHIKRLFFIIAAVLAGGIMVRAYFVPESFGQYGYYRGDALQEEQSRPVTFSEQKKCAEAECHEEKYLTKEESKHKPVVCENCHGAFAFHPGEEKENKEKFGTRPERDLCLTCHRKEPARPEDFPTIVEAEHYLEGEELPQCILCHDPHSPSVS